MRVRSGLLFLGFLLAVLALVPSRAADAQTHIELSPCPGHVSFSFDLPSGYTVTEQSENIVRSAGPAVTSPFDPSLPLPGTLGVVSGCEKHPGRTPKEAAYEVVAEVHALPTIEWPHAVVVAEGPLTVGQLEGYAVRVQSARNATETDTYNSSLFVVFHVAGDDYLWLYIGGNMEQINGADLLLENGEPASGENQRGYDAIVSSLTVSVTPLVTPDLEATPMPGPVTPTPEGATRTREGVTPTAEFTPISTAAAEPGPAAPGGERVKVGPIEEGGKQYTFSFSLPEGYTIAELTPTELTAQGPLTDETADPDEFRVTVAGVFPGTATVGDTARGWAEARCERTGRSQILVEGSLSLGEANGYFVQWACMRESTTGPVADHEGLIVLTDAKDGRFAQLYAYHSHGNYGWSGEPTDGEPAVVTGIFRIGGRPLVEVHRANLDALLASLSVSIEDLGVTRSGFARSVPGPDEISTDPGVIGSNIILTLFVVFAFAFTATLFNETIDENRHDIERWAGKFFSPFRGLTGVAERRYGEVGQRWPWVQAAVGPAAVLLLTGLIYGFLEPGFGLNTRSAVLFVALVAGVGAVTYVYHGGKALFTRRRFRIGAGVRLYGVALVIAAGCVLLSRLVDFKPGFLFGFVASYTLLAPAALDRRQEGQTVLFPAAALAALSVIAWLLVIPLRDVAQESESWWVALPEGAAVTVFVVGLEGLFFNMIPVTFMDGAKVAGWNRLLWFVMFATAGFLFWHVLLNQEGAYMEPLRETRVITALSLLAFYSLITIGTWAYFRGRIYGWHMPPMPWRHRPL